MPTENIKVKLRDGEMGAYVAYPDRTPASRGIEHVTMSNIATKIFGGSGTGNLLASYNSRHRQDSPSAPIRRWRKGMAKPRISSPRNAGLFCNLHSERFALGSLQPLIKSRFHPQFPLVTIRRICRSAGTQAG